LAVNFPQDYIAIVVNHSGASNPDKCEFEYEDNGRVRVGNFGLLLSLGDGQSENIFEAIENLGDQLPAGVIPIVDTGMGDFICFDYRKEGAPCIVYFSHEKNDEQAIIPLASSFAEFLGKLRKPDDL